jgi:gliding motility-associated-like protein
MTERKQQIVPLLDRKISSLFKSLVCMFFIVLLIQQEALFAQVISNYGAAVSTASGVVVGSKDFDNKPGSLFGNNGTITLTGDFTNDNTAATSGNGFYNLKGNWTNNGIFSAGTSTVTFNGVTNQLITHGYLGETFYILNINNPGNIVTQSSNAGGKLDVLNDLNLTAGTLSLGPTTLNLNVGGKAAITGALVYNGITPQTTTIVDNLTGSGTIDMSGGSFPHLLYLAGAINAIGTLTTSPTGSSTIDYNGTNQTAFPSPDYRNLIISNSGTKTLQGSSLIGINLHINAGTTFDLGTTTSTLGVSGTTSVAGALSFNGTSVKTVSLTGDLSGAGGIDMSGGDLAHLLNLSGATNSIGSFATSTLGSSTVDYLNGNQIVFISDNYRNIITSGGGVKTLNADISASGVLTMTSGDINSNGNTFKITNGAPSALIYTSGTVIGKLQRAIGTTGNEYLYPVGTSTGYNPLKLTFQNLTSGPLTAQYKAADIGNAGLPLDDIDNEIWDRYTTGYWTLSSVAPMATGSFTVNLNHTGFGIDASASIVKRTDGGDLELDGVHGTITSSEITRTVVTKGISTTTTDFAIGRGRPKINNQPDNIDICEGSNAFFEVRARGRGTLTYQWYVDDRSGSGFVPVTDVGVYSHSTDNHLVITGAPYPMNGYLYMCIITDGQGHPNNSTSALLTVNKIPIATATIPAPECPGVSFETIYLGTSNGVTGTTFRYLITYPAGLTTNLPTTLTPAPGDVINGIITNTTDAPLNAIFTIIPTGPATTFCVGQPLYVTVTVNPIPRVFVLPANSIQCDSTSTNIRLSSPSSFTSGLISFKYTVSTTDRFNVPSPGNVTGFTSPIYNKANNSFITDNLANQTDEWQIVTYRVVPVSPVGCVDGPPVNAVVKVNPTPRVIPLNSIKPAICYGGTSDITLTTPTIMTSGVIKFDYTISLTGVPGDVVGNNYPANNLVPGQQLTFSYTNSAPPSRIDSVNSVLFAIRPKVVNMDLGAVCNAGRIVTPAVQVHPRPLKKNYPLTVNTGILVTKSLTCPNPQQNSSLAALKVIITKGADPYHIVWRGPVGYNKFGDKNDSIDIANLNLGKYTVIVSDNLSCTDSAFLNVGSNQATPKILAIPKGPNIQVSCPGGSDGKVSVYVTTGTTAPYSYVLWRNGVALFSGILTKNFNLGNPTDTVNCFITYTGLRSGSYTLIINDINNCEITSPITELKEPAPITVPFLQTDKSDYSGFNVSCRGYSNGWVVARPTGGNGSYSYLWSAANGIPLTVSTTTSLLDSVPAGTYNVLITDLLGCTQVASVTLTEPNGMQLVGSVLSTNADGNKNISCNGGNDGSIKLTISGGTGVYNALWAGPSSYSANTKDIFNLKAGTYTATVTDNNNCLLRILPGSTLPQFTLTEPPALAITNTTSKSNDGGYEINCNKGTTGWINVIVTGGGIGAYQYGWTSSDGSGIVNGQQNQSGLTAGTYHLKVTDSNGCILTKDITLTQPQPFVTQISSADITCQSPGFNNGSINLTVAGGVLPYNYVWSNGAVTEDINGLNQGFYHVTVTYNSTCSAKDSVRINLPPVLNYSRVLSDFNSKNISCFGQADGFINVTTLSGLAPYVYTWTSTNGFTGTTQDISNLKAGIYTLKIVDNNFCTATEIINMTEPGKLGILPTLSASTAGGFNINCAGDITGSITLSTVNEVKSVNYLWADGIFGNSRINLPAGNYDVVITDANNCHASSIITLTEPDSLKLKFDISLPFCPDKPNGEIRLKLTGGVIGTDYYYKWSDNSTGKTLSNIPKGFYKVTVKEMNGCSIKDSVIVDPLNETCLVIPNAISPNGDLINDVLNIDEIELYPLMEVKIFNRWGESIWKSEKGYPKPWDGKSNGANLPIDSYHYIIDLHNGTKPLVGNVTIVR